MKLIPEIDKGFDAVMANSENIVKNIAANMTYFPLCCSTGVLKGLSCANVSEHDKAYFAPATPRITGVDVSKVKSAKYIHEIIGACRKGSSPVFFPISVARWNALSKILCKVTDGKDDMPSDGYSNYKAAQITMCDRIVADKRDKKFRFGSYNIVFSVDQLMDWLEANSSGEEPRAKNPLSEGVQLGEVLVSTAVPGGHGARVRACIYTPDIKALQDYHDERLALVKDHVLEYLTRGSTTTEKVKDTIAQTW